MSKNNLWKNRKGIVYSTNPDFLFITNKEEIQDTFSPEKQILKIQLSTKSRKGKTVTLITGFIVSPEDLKSLEKELKTICATGGSSKNNEILIQGDFRDTIRKHLISRGYKVM